MVKFNDRKAPRLGKAEFSTKLVNAELFKEWKKENPEYKLSWNEFVKIWDDIVVKIKKEVTTNPMGLKLPFSTGELRVQFLPKTSKTYDYNQSEIEGEKVPYLGIITKGKVAKISWIRKQASKFNPFIMMFAFEHARDFGKDLSEVLFDTPEIFRRILKDNYKYKLNELEQRNNSTNS